MQLNEEELREVLSGSTKYYVSPYLKQLMHCVSFLFENLECMDLMSLREFSSSFFLICNCSNLLSRIYTKSGHLVHSNTPKRSAKAKAGNREACSSFPSLGSKIEVSHVVVLYIL